MPIRECPQRQLRGGQTLRLTGSSLMVYYMSYVFLLQSFGGEKVLSSGKRS
jgi:hypothetical protein